MASALAHSQPSDWARPNFVLRGIAFLPGPTASLSTAHVTQRVVPKLKDAGHILDLGMREFERIVDGHSSMFERMPTGTTLPRGQAAVRDENVWVKEPALRLTERERPVRRTFHGGSYCLPG
jgi:hypothetical protein